MTTVLNVPGLGGSGPEHWQTRWETLDPRINRVMQRDWEQPVRAEWVEQLDRAVRASSDVILVAHSLGCVTVAHWAAHADTSRVRAALLVAPADVECALCREVVPRSFAPLPLAPLPFPACVVASSDDPYCSLERARSLAQAWAARFEDVGAQGHINAASNLGDWQQGRALLASLVAAAPQQ